MRCVLVAGGCRCGHRGRARSGSAGLRLRRCHPVLGGRSRGMSSSSHRSIRQRASARLSRATASNMIPACAGASTWRSGGRRRAGGDGCGRQPDFFFTSWAPLSGDLRRHGGITCSPAALGGAARASILRVRAWAPVRGGDSAVPAYPEVKLRAAGVRTASSRDSWCMSCWRGGAAAEVVNAEIASGSAIS